MVSPKDAFNLFHWMTPRKSLTLSPLVYNGKLISNQEERACTLRDSLLTRYHNTDDLPACTFTGEARIPWKDELSETEVRKYTIGSGNTCPGADRIWVGLLTACWDSIGLCVTHLFRACLRIGYHLNFFKPAEIKFLPKAGRNLSSIKCWRPIALLSCIGKGLERIIAKRMSYLAINSEVVGRQQFGALPKRSEIELVSCVVHDIEEARTQGWSSTLVTMNVEGTFDAVLHSRLIRRMQTQGWPINILGLISSLLKNRHVQVQYLGGITTTKKLVCGIPQGSSISPLLFLLFMEEPMKNDNTVALFSYANDIGILGIGRTVTESTAAAQQVNSVLEWADNNAISFDPQKSEVTQFPSQCAEALTNIQVNGTSISPDPHFRWLSTLR